jgi:ACS family hexuronate transporter-like MFS transporter
LTDIMIPLIVVYNASSVGSVAGGWLSGGLLKRGWTLNSARKTAMLICGLSVLPVLYAPYCTNLWVVVGLVSLATAVHQGWSANLFTLASDLFPRAAVGSVVGIGGTAGSLGGVLVQIATGYIVQLTHSYLPLFMFAGCGYLIALGIIHLLSPKLAMADLD